MIMIDNLIICMFHPANTQYIVDKRITWCHVLGIQLAQQNSFEQKIKQDLFTAPLLISLVPSHFSVA